MADGTLAVNISPEATYGTRTNIRYPGTQTAATAAATRAIAVINDRLPSGVTIAGVTITAAT